MNLKVGRIIECKKHINAEKLYVSQIQVDITNDEENQQLKTIQVCSGLAGFVPIEDMQNKRVVVLTNLKPSKMRGEKSEAMLLAALNSTISDEPATEVELIIPPSESKVGDSLFFQSYFNSENPPRLKSKVWASIQSRLKVNDDKIAVYVNEDNTECPLTTKNNENAAYTVSLKNSPIS